MTDDDSIILDMRSNLAKFTVAGKEYFFGASTGLNSIPVRIYDFSTRYEVLSGKAGSYKMGSGVLNIHIDTDDCFNYAVKSERASP